MYLQHGFISALVMVEHTTLTWDITVFAVILFFTVFPNFSKSCEKRCMTAIN